VNDSLSNASVLVVDDEPATRHMLRLFLELFHFTVCEAEDGLDALAKIGAQRPGVVVLDVMMPNLDGIATCKRLRSDPATADLPIIMLSGKTQPAAVEEGLRAGANHYLAKPFAPMELVDAIRAISTPLLAAA
jgi:DNA-binding response OmpR family regulator